MNSRLAIRSLRLVSVLALATLIACTSSDADVSTSAATTAALPTTTSTAAPSSAVTATEAVTPASTPMADPMAAPTAQPASPDTGRDLLAEGRVIFEETGGGIGCAYCHGFDGKGKAEFATPPNRGATADAIWDAFQTRPQMSFIDLSDDEIEAVAVYLQYLATQP